MNENPQKTFPEKEVYDETLKYFNGDELATKVWINKYCLKDSDGNLYEKTPDDMHRRLAKELHRIESKYSNPLSEEKIFETLRNFNRIVPQGSPMSGIGNNHQITSIGNCFVIGNDSDSYGGIFNLDQEQAQLMKRRGGVGHDLSNIRPALSPVNNDALTSTGIVPFMERFSNTTKEVAQSGRRGALMESLSVKHPDIESFIDAKLTQNKITGAKQNKITGANISVKIHDDFMEAVNKKIKYRTQYPINSDNPKMVKDIDAESLWKKIIHNAWATAEPGVLFWDTILKESIPSCYGKEWIETSTNPCGELPLPPYDSCRLLALNLYGYVVNPFTAHVKFDWELFENDVLIAQRYMDDIVDLELEKIDKILNKIDNDPEPDTIKVVEKNLWIKLKKMTETGRRTGLGVTGEGDMLAALGFRYGTDKANNFVESLHETLKLKAYKSSVILAKERGAFKIYDWEREKNNPFINRIKNTDFSLYKRMKKYGRRNIALLTIAPTGTVSLMTQTTSGIEPVFLPVYKRRRKINSNEKDIKVDFVDDEGIAWAEYTVFHHHLETWLNIMEYDIDVVKSMSNEQLDEIVKQSPYYKATSNDVDWIKKVEMQGRIQKHVDHSISVTVNLPSNVTENVVAEVYETGHKVGCKGITVYRDGSRSGVLISNDDNEKKDENFHDNHAPKRPKRVKGDIIRFQNNLEKWIAVVGLVDGRPYELFVGRLENGLSDLPISVVECEIVKNIVENENGERKKRYDIEYIDSDGTKQIHTGLNHTFNQEYWNYAKLISSVLRHGMPLSYVYELIRSLNLNDEHLNTWKAGIERVIKKYIKDGEKAKGTCLNCGSEQLEFKEGCLTCMNCGWSGCS